MDTAVIQIDGLADIVRARQSVRDTARELGLTLADQTRIATSVSELTRNIIQYAGSGKATITGEKNKGVVRIQVVVSDNGPGIADIEKAMGDGFSTSGGLGMGLPGVKRLVEDFEIESRPGHGTTVSIAVSRRLRV